MARAEVKTTPSVKKTPHKRPGRHSKKAPKAGRKQSFFTQGVCR